MLQKTFLIITVIFLLAPSLSYSKHRNDQKQEIYQYLLNLNPFANNKMKKYQNSERPMYADIFDSHAIFNFDQEISNARKQQQNMKSEFAKEFNLIKAQISYLEKELLKLAQEHQEGTDRSKEILDAYVMLFELCNKSYELIDQQLADIHNVFQDIKNQYHQKGSSKVKMAKENPQVLVSEIVDRYKMMKEK